MNASLVNSKIRQLALEKCVPCKTAVPFSEEDALERLKELPGWALQSGSVEKTFRFKSYGKGLEFAYALGRIAEAEDHHPDICVGWRRVRVSLATHAIKGLSMNDFIMAAKSEIEYAKNIGC